MQYLGGKGEIADAIGAFLNQRVNGRTYLEPFCGGLNVTRYVSAPKMLLSDSHQALITLYRSMMNGWQPPTEISKEEWDRLNLRRAWNDPLTAFAGFGCSFAGKYFCSYARGASANYALNARNLLLKKFEAIRSHVSDVRFEWCSYREWKPEGMLIYCDPPYGNVDKSYVGKRFDSDIFWNVMREWSKSNEVYVSEYAAPDDFDPVLIFPSQSVVRNPDAGPRSSLRAVEKVFRLKLPATQLPATQLPATQLPATQLPATQLPATQLPATQLLEGTET